MLFLPLQVCKLPEKEVMRDERMLQSMCISHLQIPRTVQRLDSADVWHIPFTECWTKLQPWFLNMVTWLQLKICNKHYHVCSCEHRCLHLIESPTSHMGLSWVFEDNERVLLLIPIPPTVLSRSTSWCLSWARPVNEACDTISVCTISIAEQRVQPLCKSKQ